jgi:predicted MPP superfamily phosphohydrolase
MVDRFQLVLYRNGWPSRLSQLCGFHPSLRIVEHAIELPGGPRETPVLTLAFATDFHAGVTTNPDLLRRACEALEVAKPDVLLLGGDFVAVDARQIDWIAPLIGRIPAPLGRYAVLGNHDRWDGADYITRGLENAGIEVLNNRSRRLSPPFHHIWICGLDDFLAGDPDVRAAVAGADGARVMLMHSPANLLDLDGERFDLALCGHTHGGQIALPGGTPISAGLGPLSRLYNRGRFRLAHGGTLVVSVGLGCSTVPVRVNSDPELVICRIVSAPAPAQS